MEKQAVRKVAGGKFLRLRSRVVEGKLHKPQLSGDFFLMPSEKISKIERAMHGALISDRIALAERITRLLVDECILLVGISPEDIAEAVADLQ